MRSRPGSSRWRTPQTAVDDEIHEPLRADARRPQQREGFRQDGDGRRGRLFDRCEGFDASPVAAISRIEQRDQRAGIDQDHRPCFSPIPATAITVGVTWRDFAAGLCEIGRRWDTAGIA